MDRLRARRNMRERFRDRRNPMDDDMEEMFAMMADAEAQINNRNNPENLPVAMPVRMLRDRRRRRLMGRGGDDLWDAAAILQAEEDPVSSFLYDLITEDLPCSAVLSGAHVRNCRCILERLAEHPDEAKYQCSRTGRSPLHEAALRGGCHHVVQQLLQADPNSCMQLDFRQNTPLHLLFMGITSRTEHVLELLLRPMAMWVGTLRNSEGNLVLHCACAAPLVSSAETIQALLTAASSAAGRTNHQEQTPLHLHCMRRDASVDVARLLMVAHPEALQVRDRAPGLGFSPLHYAAQQANHPLIQLLAEEDPVAAAMASVSSSQSPLHMLCQQNPNSPEDLQSITTLLAAAPAIATRPEQNTRYTPLHLLCRGTRAIDAKAVEAVVSVAPSAPLIPDATQFLPLHYACENGAHPDVIRCLLNACPQAAAARTRKNDTALTLACAANQSAETVQLLLEAHPGAVLGANDYGFLPIHCSCRAYQPKMAIVQALVKACPEAVLETTHAGETVLHLISNNAGASIGFLDVLQRTVREQQVLHGAPAVVEPPRHKAAKKGKTDTSWSSTSVGNTPLHVACFHDSSRAHIESLAASHPEWITVRNNAGYSPLQILCKNGRIDDGIITLFSRLCGPKIFSQVDLLGNTPLHSAMREETDVDVLRAIIRAYPDSLHMKTSYDDTPLHLACLRRVRHEVVREVALASSTGLETALASCNGRISPILIKNSAGQTPIGICMEEYQRLCKGSACCTRSTLTFGQMRCFSTLASLAKMLHYGPSRHDNRGQSLVGACVALHRKGARIDPAFIQRALHMFPEEARSLDEHRNTPLHIEASIPVEKMPLLNANVPGCCEGNCHKRMVVLRKLLEIYPGAAAQRNEYGDLPLSLMIQNGRPWDSSFALVIRTYPQALHWVPNVEPKLLPHILSRVANHCGSETLYTVIRTRPEFLLGR